MPARRAEASTDPEVVDVLDFLRVYDQIQKIQSWLIESSVSALMIRGTQRARLQVLMQQIGIDTDNPDDPGGYKKLANMRASVADRSLNPQPRVEIPGVSFFAKRIGEIGARIESFERPVADEVTLSDIVLYGHTNWSRVQSRTGHLPTEIQRIACVMADPVAYHAWDYGIQGRTADHITIGEEWSIKNGRHRSLAAVCLGQDFIADSGMDQWVYIDIEQDR